MDDLFFFTKAQIKLEDIAKIASEVGYSYEYTTFSGDHWLNIFYEDKNFWQWIELNKENNDFGGFEVPQQEKLAEFQPSSSFQISHHVISWPHLKSFLKLVLARYSGWIGCDDGKFEVTYTVENIDHLKYPFLNG